MDSEKEAETATTTITAAARNIKNRFRSVREFSQLTSFPLLLMKNAEKKISKNF